MTFAQRFKLNGSSFSVLLSEHPTDRHNH